MSLKVLHPTRAPLEANAGRIIEVVATFVQTGFRTAGRREYPTILAKNVRDASTAELLADHLWFNRGSTWRNAGLVAGDVIRFRARPIEYRAGHWGADIVRRLESPARRDFRLTTPEGLQIVRRLCDSRGEAA